MKLAWSKNEDSNTINLIKYIDENAMYFKNKYNDLLESHNKYISLNTDLYNLLSFNKAHNLNNYSLINERSFYKSPNITNVLKYLAFEDILLKNKKKIITLILDNKKIYEFLTNTNTYDNCFFELHESKKNINIYKTNTFKESIKIVILIGKVIITKLLRFFKSKNIKNEITFVSYFDNFSLTSDFKSNYWSQTIDFISKYKNYNFIHIENNPFSLKEKLKNNKLLKQINKKNKNPGFFLFDYLRLIDLLNISIFIIKNLLFVRLKIFKINHKFNKENNAINFFFKDEIIKSFKGSHLLENLIYIYSFQNLSKYILKKNHKIFYLFENQSWEKIMKNSLLNSNIYGFIHSTVRFWDLRYTADTNIINSNKKFYILNTGEGSKKILAINKIKLDKLINVESLRYLKFKKIKKNISNNKILIVGDYIDAKNYELLKIINDCKDINNIFVYKNHPNKKINHQKFNTKIELFNDKLDEISNYGFIICNYPSSAIIDFYLLNKKIITYYDLNDLNTNPLYFIENFTFFSNSFDLSEFINNKSDLIKNSLSRDFLYLNSDISMWKNFLKKHCII